MSIMMISTCTYSPMMGAAHTGQTDGSTIPADQVNSDTTHTTAEHFHSHCVLSDDLKSTLFTLLLLDSSNDNQDRDNPDSLAAKIIALYMAASALQAIGAFNYVMNAAGALGAGGAAGGGIMV